MTQLSAAHTSSGTVYGGPLHSGHTGPAFEKFFTLARTHPDAQAIVHREQALSYGELAHRALAIASALHGAGLRSPDRVGVYIERCIDATAAMLGVLAAGLVYVPIDVRNPIERIRHMVKTSHISTMLTGEDEELLAALPGVTTIGVAQAAAHPVSDELPIAVAPDSDAYVIFTSGTTGAPKGVVGLHRQFARQLEGWRQLGYDTTGMRGAVIASYGFDSSFLEHFIPLSVGGTVFVFDQDDICDTETLGERISAQGIEFAILSPALLGGVAEYFEVSGRALPLRWLISGGEPVPNSELARLQRLDPNLDIRVGYGTTEATIAVTTHRFTGEDARFSAIGTPMPGYHVLLLDPAQRPVEPGEIGEMYITGDVLTRGYDSNPEETARRYLPNPLASQMSQDAHSVMYKTGDLARIDSDGQLRFEGRVDNQIQVRGLRVELGEVESAVFAAFETRVHCSVHERADGSRAIVAFIVEQPGIDTAAAVSRLYDSIPDYMLPTYLIEVGELPITVNDKVDIHRLPDVTDDHLIARLRVSTTTRSDESTATATEAMVLESARRSLRLDVGIDLDDRFIELGADSLRVVKLVLAVQRAAGLKLPVKQMDAAQLTARTLAAHVDLERARLGDISVPTTGDAGVEPQLDRPGVVPQS